MSLYPAFILLLSLCSIHVRAAKCQNITATEIEQLGALHEFAHTFLVKKDPVEAWNDYVPWEYTQHSPVILSGRDNVLEFFSVFFADPNLSHVIYTISSGQGYGVLHYKLILSGGVEYAIMDLFRFQGTCIVEHWDVVQQIFGNETNPLAFF